MFGCEEIPNDSIDIEFPDYEVVSVNVPNLVVYSSTSSVDVSIQIKNPETVSDVWFDLMTIKGDNLINSENYMLPRDNGVIKTFWGQVNLADSLLSGNYLLVFYLKDNINPSGDNVHKVAIKQFELKTEAENFPPEISNLSIPESVTKGTQFEFSVFVSDPNGKNDIQSVYYQLKDPQGNLISNSQGISKFPMFDDGNKSTNGDDLANDGVYTVFLTFPSGSSSGAWEFSFNAEDNSGETSNTIIKTVNVN